MLTRKFMLDLGERSVWTFVQAFCAQLIASGLDLGPMAKISIGVKLLTSAIAGVVAVAKCIVATQIGAPNTASTLPAGPDTEKG